MKLTWYGKQKKIKRDLDSKVLQQLNSAYSQRNNPANTRVEWIASGKAFCLLL